MAPLRRLETRFAHHGPVRWDLCEDCEKTCISDPLMPSAILSCTQSGSTYTTTVNTAAYSAPALKLLTYLPPPSALSANGGIEDFEQPNNYGLAEVTARVDQELTPKDKLTLRYFSDEYISARRASTTRTCLPMLTAP